MGKLPSIYTGPGLVDLQVNGYAGLDFNGDPRGWTAEQLHMVRSAEARRGVVAVLPTLMTDDPALMISRAAQYNKFVEQDKQLERCFPKLHLEGPFVSSADGPRGAHPKKHCRTPQALPELLDQLRLASGGRIGIVTLAPELDGAIELISRCVDAGICPAIGHTQATAEQIGNAIVAGAKMSTHLGNGSDPMLPRLDNYVQRQLADDSLYSSIIAGGHHMPWTTLKTCIRSKTPGLSILVTDAMAAAEIGEGEYKMGGELVMVSKDGMVAKPGATCLAGSVLTLDRAVTNVTLHCGVMFSQAWAMASSNPAQMVGLPEPLQVTVEITEAGFSAAPHS